MQNELEQVAKLVDEQLPLLKSEPELLLSLAAELRLANQLERADGLMQQALQAVPASGIRRANLLWRKAATQTELPRWLTLLEALESAAGDLDAQRIVWARLNGELREAAEAEDLEQLAAAAKTESAKFHLHHIAALNEFDNDNFEAVTNLLWPHWERRSLSRSDEVWLFESCVKTDQRDRVRALLEAEMRRPDSDPMRFLQLINPSNESVLGSSGKSLKARIETSPEDLTPQHDRRNSHWLSPNVRVPTGGNFF